MRSVASGRVEGRTTPANGMLRFLGRKRGYSFVELLVVSTILLILASAVAPLARVTMQRQREVELRRALREMRTAIDRYKDAVDLGNIGGTQIDPDNQGYPPSLETLVECADTVDENAHMIDTVEPGRQECGQAALPAADSHRSDDTGHRLGIALVPGRPGHHAVEWGQCV